MHSSSPFSACSSGSSPQDPAVSSGSPQDSICSRDTTCSAGSDVHLVNFKKLPMSPAVSLSDVPARLREMFHYPLSDLVMLSDDILEKMEEGLTAPGCRVQMLPTYIFDLPKGNEKGRFFALDLGGTNLRVLEVILHGDGTHSVGESVKSKVSLEAMTGTGNELFGEIADSMATLAEKCNLNKDDEPVPTGYMNNYSF